MEHFLFTSVLFSLFHTIAFPQLTVGVDSLFPNQTIAIGQTLISQSHDFEMGFFSPGKSRNRYLGVWYKNTPDVVFWVANRNNPITDSQGITFAISRNGTLVISGRSGSVIWSAIPSGPASNTVLQLRDTGNLVLVNQTMEGGLSESHLWQSFDYPTDTWLPGMTIVSDIEAGVETYLTSWRNLDDPSPGEFVHKIDNQGLPEIVTLRGEKKVCRTGKWNGVSFTGFPRSPNHNFEPEFRFKEERLVAVTSPFQNSTGGRGKLDIYGTVQLYTMNPSKDKWFRVYVFPGDQCDEYGLCGPNGVCIIDKPVRCECLKGFTPKVPKEWNLQAWSGGCTRKSPLNCQNGDGFLEVKGVNYPDMLTYWLNTSMSLDECHSECFKNCNCTAYANPYVTNGGSGCVMWFGDLIDTREYSGANNNQNLYIRLPVSELLKASSNDLEIENKKKMPTRLILISIASGVLVSGFINGGVFLLTRRKKQATKKKNEDFELPLFKYATIVAATNNFSKENMVGEGGFGPVYKGNLSSKEEIAIKRLSITSGQGLEEFKNEVILISKLQHTNLVRLLGCCIEGEERILIYEYLQNKSLDYFIFDKYQKTLLTWPKRFHIIMGIARGLLYLHHDSRLKIIHRDLKTSNILLDGNLNPKISDFGLARIFEEDQPVYRTKRVVGTYGYMAPEYVIAGRFSVKSDVFGMGVILLEIVCGRKNRGFENSDEHYDSLLGHAWLLWQENRIFELMDECLKDTFMESEVKRCIHVGLLCVQKFAEDRPEMSSVIFMLGTDGAMLPEPKEPGFFIGRSSIPKRNSTSPSLISEGKTITITDLEAR